MDRVNVLGVGVSILNRTTALAKVDEWITTKKRNYICVAAMHSIMGSLKSDRLRSIHNRAGIVLPDGMPAVWFAKAQGIRHMQRIPGPDFMALLCQSSVKKGYRHFFYGGKQGTPELLKNKLETKFPGIKIVGTYSPPFRPLNQQEDKQIIKKINQAEPDIVWVGMSTPKQEYWMYEHRGKIESPVMIGVGAAFDLHAGITKRAPLWMQNSGLEWLYRLLSEPRRLGRRYLEVPKYAVLLLAQLLGIYSKEM